MKIKSISAAVAASFLFVATAPAQAATLTVNITNLTAGFHFTPRLLVAHDLDAPNTPLFVSGSPASEGLIAIAEGGNTAPLTATLDTDTSSQVNNTFGGLVGPASTSADYTFDSADHTHLSMLSMMIPTNDAFVGLSNWKIPTEPGTYTVNINAYDSGSEANDEINSATTTLVTSDGSSFGGAPGSPGMATPPPTQPLLGSGAMGINVDSDGTTLTVDANDSNGGEGNVHIHRNGLGDADLAGGKSDLDATVHRWLNPVARLTVTVPAQ